MPSRQVFPCYIYQDKLTSYQKLNKGLIHDMEVLRKKDLDGIEWCKKNYVGGYTSYNSITDLHERFPDFIDLKKELDKHVSKYARALKLDLMGRKLHMTISWISIMPKGTYHSMHNHPLSVISGTYYIKIPKGSSPLKLEDPKMGFLMNSPPRKENAPEIHQPYIQIPAKTGSVVLFESWMKHEVPPQPVDEERYSFSFNYEWY